MVKSNLTNVVVQAHSSNYTSGRNGCKVCKFTPHHMAGVLTAEQCGRIFQASSRNASSNYGIGNDGRIGCYVGEENRAWTSSNGENDRQAVTVEVSNSKTGGDWPVGTAAWNSLVNLAVDVCKRYKFDLKFTGDSKGSLTYHQMFANTNCPGPYLKSRMKELANTVNKILDGSDKSTTVTNKVETSKTSYKVGDTVTINGVYTASNSTKKLTPAKTSGKITKVINGALNPYLLENGNVGWTNDSCIVKKSSTSATTSKSSSSSSIKKGDKVKVLNNIDYNGKRLASWVKGGTFDVIEVSGDRVVIGKGKAVTAAVKKSVVKKV